MELCSNDIDELQTACTPLLPQDSQILHRAIRKEESFSTKVVPLNKVFFNRKLERNRHQTDLRLDQFSNKETMLNKLREITKPVLKELEVEISTGAKNLSAFAQIPMNFTPRPNETMLQTVCRSFSKEEEEAMINAIHESSHNHNAVKRFLRNYDISQVRHERVLKCFTIGRRISQSEHTDDKINTEIENNINGVCFRRLKHKKVAENAPISIEHPKGSVFGFIDFRGRTHDFYQTFAKETIENDIIREEKNLRRITALLQINRK